tara:strand:+ start:237 stop:524 length:288 start_codon:yes stop_codon:yes gene_type:complete
MQRKGRVKSKAIIAATIIVSMAIATFSAVASAVIILRATEIAMSLVVDQSIKYSTIAVITLYLVWMQSIMIDFIYLNYKHGFKLADAALKEQDEP